MAFSMAKLNLDRNIAAPDAFYEMLVGLNETDDMQTALVRMNRLALLLANHIGDPAVLKDAVDIAGADH